jgi:N-acyl homoserine lactone hydrolase
VETPNVQVERVTLGEVTFADWHPRFHEGGCPVFGYVIRHPDGVILFDTGVGAGNSFIDELYHPNVIPIATALGRLGIDERDVVAVINSHLHFDHCGQNEMFHRWNVPIYTQAAEIEAAQAFGYTVPEWASIPDQAVRRVRGDEHVTDGVRIIETPGHTPGHQSVVVDTADGPVVIAGQCVYTTDEVVERQVAPDNMHNDAFLDAGQQSLERLLSLDPRQIVMAHDDRVWPATEQAEPTL